MAPPSNAAISPGRVRSVARGRMVHRVRFQSLEANQKPALAPMERARLGFSLRGAVCAVSSLLRKSRSSCNETHKYYRVVLGGGVRA